MTQNMSRRVINVVASSTAGLSSQVHVHGIISAMVTPLEAAGDNIDTAGVSRLVRYLIDSGINGLFPLGSTGEGVLLTERNRRRMAEAVVDEAAGKVPVIVHVGAFRTESVLELAKHAKEIGADGIAVIPPSYYAMDEPALYRYFSRIAEAVGPFPIYLYNIPSNAKNWIRTPLFLRLAEAYPFIVGMKESSMDFSVFYDFVQSAAERHVKLIGNDDLILPALAIGGSGAISAGSTALPEPYVALYRAYREGDMAKAGEWQKVCSLVKKMLNRACPIAPHKKLLSLRGLISDKVAEPLRQLTEQEFAELKASLNEIQKRGVSLS